MKKITLLFIASMFAFTPLLKADEGMWLLMYIDKQTYKDMKAKGLKLTSKQIYDINHSSLKDAIIQFGRGCTGEIVSDQGLILTNHHCGYPQIQQHSSIEHDYLSNGFWAYSKDEELPNPGLTAKFLVRMEDVSNQVLQGVTSKMGEQERLEIVRKNSKKIKENAEKGNTYTAEVATMFNGNQYFLFIYEVYEDVRLVGAPPSNIGKFGGDTDNWMWPRHTGDFSVFRVYANKNNEPADYSPENVPYVPKKHLKINLNGVKEGDFTFVFGYPGTTRQFLTSDAVDFVENYDDPARIKLRTAILDVYNRAMNNSAAQRLRYASDVASVANGWKKWQGEVKEVIPLDSICSQQPHFKPNNERMIRMTKFKKALITTAALATAALCSLTAYAAVHIVWVDTYQDGVVVSSVGMAADYSGTSSACQAYTGKYQCVQANL